MQLTERVLKAWAGTMIPLRTFMGLQMMVYALSVWGQSLPSRFKAVMVDQPYGELWLLGLGGAGLWIVASAGAEGWTRIQNAMCPWKVCPLILNILSNSRFYSYFFAGCVWLDIMFEMWLDGYSSIMDHLAPLFLFFLVWAAVNDATQQRKKVEKTQAFDRMFSL